MQYQDRSEAAQAADRSCAGEAPAPPSFADANINPATGLATDYLNHFNEAIMLLEMLPACPECRDDLLGWRPVSYREHFALSRFKGRDLAVAAYEAADPAIRGSLDALARTMTAVLEAVRMALRADMPPEAAGALAERTATWLKPLVARAGAVINGEVELVFMPPPQAVVDGLIGR